MTTYELTSLALQAGKGDADALVALVDHVCVDIRRAVRSRVPIAESDDVEQDVWHTLMRCLSRYEGRSQFSTWLYIIVMRRIADYWRRMRSERVFGQRIAEYISQNSQIQPMQSDVVIDDILARCPELYREILQLHICYGMTFHEIEAKTGIKYETARSRYRRGVTWLRSNADRLGLSSSESSDWQWVEEAAQMPAVMSYEVL